MVNKTLFLLSVATENNKKKLHIKQHKLNEYFVQLSQFLKGRI